MGMFCDVGEQFTYGLEQDDPCFILQRFACAVVAEVELHRVVLLKLPAEPRDSRLKPHLIENGNAELGSQ